MISAVVNTVIRIYEGKTSSERYLEMISVTQIHYAEALSFHTGHEFHAILQSLQKVIDVKNVTLKQM